MKKAYGEEFYYHYKTAFEMLVGADEGLGGHLSHWGDLYEVERMAYIRAANKFLAENVGGEMDGE